MDQRRRTRATARHVAGVAAIVPGRVLQGVFGVVGLVRPAPKPLHPSGRLLDATIQRFGLAGPDRVGVPWIDGAGQSPAVARFSRATGLPAALPDIHGLAIRIDGEADLLMATTGLGRVSRFVLSPTRDAGSSAYSTLFPYSTAAGPLLLAATPDPRDPARHFLAFASLSGPWKVFAELRVGTAGPVSTGDASISFDPVLHQLDGLGYYEWATRLREGAYRAARWSRDG